MEILFTIISHENIYLEKVFAKFMLNHSRELVMCSGTLDTTDVYFKLFGV